MTSPVLEPSRIDGSSGVTIGVTGQRPRWSVSHWGSVVEWGQSTAAPLDWYVAADDRWHVPSDEPTVRQRRIDGTPVVETRVRVPDGDAVQRVWAVPERGGLVVVEVENESPHPFAVAFTGPPVLTERPPADVEIRGLDLPSDAFLLPVGHHASVRVVLASADARAGLADGAWPAVPPAASVVSGWTTMVGRASRLALPDETLVEAVAAARCDLLLEGPVDPVDDPAGFLLDVAELVRCGDDAERWLLEIVEPAERVARRAATARGRRKPRARRSDDAAGAAVGDDADDVWQERREAHDALLGARRVARAGGDERAGGDLDRIIADLTQQEQRSRPTGRRFGGRRRSHRTADRSTDPAPPTPVLTSFADVRRSASVGRFVRSIERLLVDPAPTGGAFLARPNGDSVDDDSPCATAALLPGGIPTAWLGSNFEVHGIPAASASDLSFAVRWHGARPAVLWERSGDPIRLTSPDLAPGWSTTEQAAEALWDAPASSSAARLSLSITAVEADERADHGSGAGESAERAAPSAPAFDPESGSFS